MIKLKEINTENGLDLLCTIAENFYPISQDKIFDSIFKDDIKVKKGMKKQELEALRIQKIFDIMMASIPKLLKDYRENLYNIMAALHEIDKKELKEQPLIKTVAMVTEIFKDKELIDFFTSLIK